MSKVHATVGGAFAGKTDPKEVKKTMERSLIKSVYAPSVLSGCKEIVSKYDEEIVEIASQGKSDTTAVTSQLDSGIKGKGRKAVEETIEKHKDSYDEL